MKPDEPAVQTDERQSMQDAALDELVVGVSDGKDYGRHVVRVCPVVSPTRWAFSVRPLEDVG